MLGCRSATILLGLAFLPSFISGGDSSLEASLKSTTQGIPQVPVARTKPFQHKYYNDIINDPYQWIKDDGLKSNDVQQFLRNEASYSQQVLESSRSLRDNIFKRKSALSRDLITDKWQYGSYTYYTRKVADKPYSIYYRRSTSVPNAAEEMILDVNALGTKAGAIREIKANIQGTLIAFTIDAKGDERHTLYFKDPKSSNLLPYEIRNVGMSIEWSGTGRSIFYTTIDKDAVDNGRARYTVGDPVTKFQQIYTKSGDVYTYEMSVASSRQYLFITEYTATASNTRYLDITTDSANTLAAITPPMQGQISAVHHLGRQFLFAMSLEARGREYNVYYACDFDKRTRQFQACGQVLNGVGFYYMKFIVFQNHFVTIESATLTPKINVYDLNNGRLLPNTAPHVINLSGDSYAVTLPFQWTYESDVLQFTYSTVVKPPTLYTYPMKTKIPVTSYLSPLPQYKEEDYATKVIMAGGIARRYRTVTPVPVTIAYKKSLMKGDGTNFAWLTGYGAYGQAYPVGFSSSTIPLLDQGFVYAIAHVRGGNEQGPTWRSEGMRLNKKNTFNDFIQAADALVSLKYTRHELLAISGSSAGGMMVGAVINERPDIAKVAILDVPFLNVLDTMMDPKNINADDDNYEWGTPLNDRSAYDAIKSYSPYDNLKVDVKYPNILVIAGIHDPRVPYWDPSKWVAKMRAINAKNSRQDTDPSTVVMMIDEDAGHFGNGNNNKHTLEISTQIAYAMDKLQKSARYLAMSVQQR
ncbi:prolyl oligopeptidase family-domain-containing protein [Syncephalis plumigaleata]|nr:prolyl oligopeptidase family-domain-containing protein [Syncephalis plumigaleata]